MILKVLNKTRDISVLIWVGLCILAIARFASISGERTFQYDEWNFVLNRWQLSLDTFLRPHNSHLSVFPAAIFLFCFEQSAWQIIGFISLLVS